jgi:MinD superfamily P-loop ATPase
MTKEITVTVSGVPGCGKTTIAAEVFRHLESMGFTVVLDDVDVECACDHPHLQPSRLDAIRPTRKITVRTQNTRRPPPVNPEGK